MDKQGFARISRPVSARVVTAIVMAATLASTCRLVADQTDSTVRLGNSGQASGLIPLLHSSAERAVPTDASLISGDSASAMSSSTIIGSQGGQLMLDGELYRFVGVNAYEIATDWGVNGSCGPMESDSQLDELFSSLPPNSLVRFWAWQGSASININTHQLDWAPLDRVFATADAYHQRLIVVLAGQSGECDGGIWKDPSWYDGGFMQIQDSSGLTPLSYWDYLQAVVNRYKNSPALGMWEPISEPEASTCPEQYEPSNCAGHQTCPDEAFAEGALRHFFDVVGDEIHLLDPDHLVESGTIGSGQCGTSGTDFESVSASPGIDVLSYHDYYKGSALLGGDQWNGLRVRFRQARSLHKPIMGGEMGIDAGSGRRCRSLQKRSEEVRARVRAQVAAGSSGVLLWNWMPRTTSSCDYDITPGDPVLASLASDSVLARRVINGSDPEAENDSPDDGTVRP